MPDGIGVKSEVGDNSDIQSVREQKEKNNLYAARTQVYPRKVRGRFRQIKWAALSALLTIYYLTPWLRWNRGPGAPDQAVLVDLGNERGYFFFIEIWPQEVYYLTGILVMAAIGLFLVTSLAGRVWCGYACPQTVWTDLFMWVERQIEGDRSARIRLDRQPWSLAKAGRKTAKHVAWLVIAFLTGGAWIMYFVDAPTFVSRFFVGDASTEAYFFIGLFTATTYTLAGWAREQVCTFMCPWPRFQAAMLDEDSLVVTYDKFRGEPRGPHRKGQEWGETSHCIDCKQCIAVCPTGIDIRDGIQLECIGCGLCVDACNEVMGKINLPPNLIAFNTERRMQQKVENRPLTYRLLRPRTILYTMLLLGVAGLMVVGLMSRQNQGINVLHDRTLFIKMSNGDIQNSYTVKILNKERSRRLFTLTVKGLASSRIVVVGKSIVPTNRVTMTAPADGLGEYRIHLRAPEMSIKSPEMAIRFILIDPEGNRTVRKTTFRAPARVKR